MHCTQHWVIKHWGLSGFQAQRSQTRFVSVDRFVSTNSSTFHTVNVGNFKKIEQHER